MQERQPRAQDQTAVIGELILIADDEPDVLEVSRYTLQLEGYRVHVARDGLEAVERARHTPFDLFLTDLKMPRLGGLDAFRRIREFEPAIVGVAMTGYGTMTTAIEALKLGFSEFVIKPFTPKELSAAVSRAFEKERLRRENVRLKALIPLFELSRAFMSTTDVQRLLDKVAQTGLRETHADRAACLLIEPGTDRFRLAARAGKSLDPSLSPVWDRLGRQVARTRQPLVVDPNRSPASFLLAGEALETGVIVALPLIVQDRMIGVLLLGKPSGAPPFSQSDTELLSVLAGQAAVAIENATLFRKIQDAYRELEKTDHLKSEFINVAAHELRTPLALILGYAGLLEESVEGEAREYLQAILQSGTRLRTIVDDMVNLRSLELKQVRLTRQPISLEEVIAAAVDAFQPLAASKRIRLYCDVPAELAQIEADPQKLELILGNLLSNAIKFTPPGGEVAVIVRSSAERECDDVVVRVRDSGPGIPLPAREQIFARFYQVEESLTRAHNGIGLGLAIVRGMVELHGGRVWVESEVEQGSTFAFTIPRSPAGG
ncbi:MAG TPA: hypothetical protein DEP84_30640 [Chloroflexi bacterium]|nr:hypothetical protein [Chloroflexota bacterium]